MPKAPSNPGTLRVMSAARTAPLQKGGGDGPLGKRLAGEASNQVLNALSILKELAADFRQRDRFFKYKASIIAGWLMLSAASFVIACPGSSVKTGDMDARLVLGGRADRPSVTIWNESRDTWRDITLIVNGQYRAAVGAVGPGESITLTPKQLIGSAGAAPADLRFETLEMRTRDDQANLTDNLNKEWERLRKPR
ncbi:hypothetical protein LY474_27190 [Myxococcus stipitatus]|uniref:hypothetical protein n=1 Tax=Myxococcus stipitatus TaxID=83455 RepID=UPI001F367124|nr:hypothetical protein [Myxococcus stipitatus]MCE9671497.1 hypothetical protein [Myxococcus stipitatus]